MTVPEGPIPKKRFFAHGESCRQPTPLRPTYHGTLVASSVPDAARPGQGKPMSRQLPRRRRIKELQPNDPRSCYQVPFVRNGRRCSRCEEVADVVHVPTVHIGYFCGKCCPACGAGTSET